MKLWICSNICYTVYRGDYKVATLWISLQIDMHQYHFIILLLGISQGSNSIHSKILTHVHAFDCKIGRTQKQ